jgi:hypothetical protein
MKKSQFTNQQIAFALQPADMPAIGDLSFGQGAFG